MISSLVRRFGGALACAGIAFVALTMPAHAQMREQIADKIVTTVANDFVAKISGESCSQFAATMHQMKGSQSGGSTSSKLKNNPTLRHKFVDIVAAPLLNKMIDCNMLPGGM